jgi:hypothetical protein
MPVIMENIGRTSATDAVPVTPKTATATAPSFAFVFQRGRGCVVHFQNAEKGE